MNAISFELDKLTTGKSRARAGILTTPHGIIRTPAFVPVGTKADVKGILPEQLKALGAEIVLANTYHLYLRPGEEIVKAAGGLGKFMSWVDPPPPRGSGEAKPTMTDSGGFQVFSLGAAFGLSASKFGSVGRPDQRSGLGKTISKFVKEDAPQEEAVTIFDEEVASKHGQLAVIDDEGVSFTSHLDGSLHRFTPERSVEIQHALGADIFFAFDECTSPTEPYEYQREAMERTHRWAKRCLDRHRGRLRKNFGEPEQGIFGIVQGGRFEDLRRESAHEITALGFDGIGIGGSFSKEDMKGALQAAVGELPEELPRHFLGIGEPGDILEVIAGGMDLFDCVAPTRIGRHGSIYTKRGIIHLRNGQYRNDFTPLSHVGTSYVPTSDVGRTTSYMGGEFTLAYVSHLVRSGEMLGSVICSMHNIGFILRLVQGAREAILDDRFDEYRQEFMRNYYST